MAILLSGHIDAQTEASILQEQIQSLDLKSVIQEFSYAPEEDQARVDKSFLKVDLLMPDGAIRSFEVVRNDLLHPDFEALYPEINNYSLVATDNEEVYGRATVSPYGFMASIFTEDGLVNIQPVDKQNPVEHQYTLQGEYYRDYACGVTEEGKPVEHTHEKNILSNGADLRTFNFAVVTTGEYGQDNGGTPASGAAAVTQAVSNVEMIYERELAVNFNLLPPQVYTNPNTDPFTPGNTNGQRTSKAAQEVNISFPTSTSYDIGHVLHSTGGGNWGGGVAGLGVVCSNNPSSLGGFRKAAGWSSVGAGNPSVGSLDLFAHELGHMFDMPHTWNGSGSSCTIQNHSSTTAYEIASGSTTMSYQGICQASHNIPQAFTLSTLYFHANSLQRAVDYMNTAGTCSGNTTTNNGLPMVDANPCGVSHTIPVNTAFRLKGSGSDADGDQILYCWEQYDEDGPGEPTYGFIGAQAANSAIAPLFRSYPPSTSPERFFPDLSLVVNNDYVSSFEPLPQVARTLTFRLTGRDRKAGGGGINIDQMVVTVDGSGPFQVNAPNGGETLTAGNTTTVTWSVNGTNAYCNNVNINLSIDGGLTYPYILSASTPNDGSQQVTIPSSVINATTARVKVECADSDCVAFFDISNNDFTVTSACNAALSNICPIAPVNLPAGDAGLNLTQANKGPAIMQIPMNSGGGLPTGGIAIRTSDTNPACTEICTFGLPYQLVDFTVDQDGDYVFSQSSGGFAIATVFQTTSAAYNAGSPCNNNYIGSNSFATGSCGAGGNGNTLDPTFTLTACTDYLLAFYYFDTNTTGTFEISGVGQVVGAFTSPGADYPYTYVAVNTANQQVAAVSSTSDFTSLTAGNYEVYGVSYYSGGGPTPPAVNPASWVGQTVSSVLNSDCVFFSDNNRPVTVGGGATTPVFTISGSPSLNEGNGGVTSFNFTITRTGDLSNPSSIDFTTSGSGTNPANAADFDQNIFPSGTVPFVAGDGSEMISIPVQGDTNVEPDEGFTITLSNPVNGIIGTPSNASGTILNDDSNPNIPTVSISGNPSLNEGNSGTTAFAFTLTRTGDLSNSSTIDWTIDFGASTADNADFAAPVSGSISFAATENTQNLTINVNGDTTVEPDENFEVDITANNNAIIGTSTATGTILNDDSNGNPNCTTFTYSGPPVSIPDNTPAGVTADISVAGLSGNIDDVNVYVNGTHGYTGDLSMDVISPNGTTVRVLNTNFPGCGTDFDITYDDEAANPITCPIDDGQTEIPDNLLSAFDIEAPNGTWLLNVADNDAFMDIGEIVTWSVEICTATASCVTPTITNVVATDSDCSSSGTITITATGNSLEYSIDGGANWSAAGANVFTGLAPGEYDIQAREASDQTCLGVFANNPVKVFTISDQGFASADTPIAISAAGPNTISSTIAVSGVSGTINTVTIAAIGDHTWADDLVFTLISPQGTSINLIENQCSDTDDFSFELSDAAFNAFSCNLTDNSGQPKVMRPQANTMAGYSGETPNGNWILQIDDQASGDGGQLTTWIIGFCLNAQACPPTLAIPSNPINSGTYEAQNTINSDGTTPNGNNVIFSAPEVNLEANFEVQLGGLLEIQQTGCTPLKGEDTPEGQ